MSFLSFLINDNKLFVFFLFFFCVNLVIAIYYLYKDYSNKKTIKEMRKKFIKNFFFGIFNIIDFIIGL